MENSKDMKTRKLKNTDPMDAVLQANLALRLLKKTLNSLIDDHYEYEATLRELEERVGQKRRPNKLS